jgi:hypothetical protein
VARRRPVPGVAGDGLKRSFLPRNQNSTSPPSTTARPAS